MKLTFSALVFIALTISYGAPPLDQQLLKRKALIAGSNYGGPNRVRLQYAHSDAKTFSRVLESLGGLEPSDLNMLLEPSKAQFIKALNTMRLDLKKAKSSHKRVEMILYYSGHADEEGLLLGKEKLSYRDLKEAIKEMPADIRVAVVDACASGALTRLKGGKRSKPFLFDESSEMTGYALLTSSSADEASQESARIGGSYFTHSLVSGLRGAADLTQDGRVTLNEAYQYAFHETLARTEKTQAGPQHAGYDIQLSGSGEVIMTDLRGTSAGLSLSEDMDGRLFVRDKDGVLTAELRKYRGRSLELGLEPGVYNVTLQKETAQYSIQVVVEEKSQRQLKENEMKPVTKEQTVSRGGPAPASADSSAQGNLERVGKQLDQHIKYLAGKLESNLPRETGEKKSDHSQLQPSLEKTGSFEDTVTYDTIPVSFSMLPNLKKKDGKLRPPLTYHNYSFNLFLGYYGKLEGIGIGLLGQWCQGDVRGGQFSGLLNYAGGSIKGIQAAGLANVTLGRIEGFQGASVLNVSQEVKGGQWSGTTNAALKVRGWQGAGVNNFALNIKGGQGAGIANFARDVKGGQGAGIANFAVDLTGGQGAGIANFARDVKGGQGAAIGNFARDVKGGQGSAIGNFARDVKGAQGSAIGNFARRVEGVQASSIVNAAAYVNGGQFGAILNAAGKVDGVQVGFFNFAGEVNGQTIGILNINKKAELHPGVWMDESGMTNISFKSGMKYTYGILNFGYSGMYSDKERLISLGWGIGGKVPINYMVINADIGHYRINRKSDFLNLQASDLWRLRVGGALQALSHLGLNAGLTLNLMYNQADLEYQDYIDTYKVGGKHSLIFWPGFYVGVDF